MYSKVLITQICSFLWQEKSSIVSDDKKLAYDKRLKKSSLISNYHDFINSILETVAFEDINKNNFNDIKSLLIDLRIHTTYEELHESSKETLRSLFKQISQKTENPMIMNQIINTCESINMALNGDIIARIIAYYIYNYNLDCGINKLRSLQERIKKITYPSSHNVESFLTYFMLSVYHRIIINCISYMQIRANIQTIYLTSSGEQQEN